MPPETIVKICEYLLIGMSEKESCVMASFPYQSFIEQKELSQELRETIERKAIEFKFNHLKEIQKNKSEKNSMWILEKLRPDEFAGKKPTGEGTTVNIINAIIKDIQNDNQGIVKITRRGKATFAGGADQSATLKKLQGTSILV